MPRRAGRRAVWAAIALALLVAGVALPAAAGQTPTPTADPLATPVLPETPTQVDLGRAAYYYNCMPCHGDRGQGLTDAWRQVWEEDHQDCWARGCHGGLPGDEGFPIPQTIPAVIGVPAARAYEEEALRRYLRETHPPQRPGALSAEEYAALTAFLLAENGVAAESTATGPLAAGIAGLLLVCVAGAAAWVAWRRRRARPA